MRVVSSLAVVLCFLLLTVPARPQDVLTPVIASPLHPTAFAFRGTDHCQHLVYELVITNTGSASATLQQIEIIDKDSPAKVLAAFEGATLLARLWTPGHAPATTPQIEPNGTRLFLADFTMDASSPVPRTLLHRFHLLASGPPGSPKDEAVPYTYIIAPIAVSTDIAVLGPPLTGKGWVALNGCCEPAGAHRSTGLPVNGAFHYTQRFAVDWMQLDADARFSRGDGKDVHDYADYGAKVIAVADGIVVETLSSLDDQPVGSLPDPRTITLENVDGNHIVLDLGHGRYAFYAHLQKDSLLVVKGQHVKRGQVLALLGNTGNTSAPHLHFHLMDGPSVLGSSGLPYVIDHFQVAGHLSRERFDKTGIDGVWSEGLNQTPSDRSEEFPLDLTAVNF